MSGQEKKAEWLLLVHQLPVKPTSLRVRTWRKLQKLGAVAIKNSVYVLPFGDRTFEDFQWLKQEIEAAGGEAAVFRAGSVEGATDAEIITLFQNARDEEFKQITAELDGLSGAIREQRRGGHLSPARFRGYETDLDRLHKELDRTVSTDFFGAPARTTALAAFERAHGALLGAQSRKTEVSRRPSQPSTLDLSRYQGRRWITRQNLFIDRLASIWLIKRFIDKRPRFAFVSDDETVKGGIAFDMFGAEFTHQGEDCTFE